MSSLESIFNRCIEKNASDIHLSVDIPPTYRINGRLRHFGEPVLTHETLEALVHELAGEKYREDLRTKPTVEFSYAHPSGNRFRVSIFRQSTHFAAAMRLIPSRIFTMEEIGLPNTIKRLLDRNHGLILVAGPTGVGKSTTLASMIDYINETDDRHIITVEDPIEFVHRHKKSIINQRQLGSDTDSFAKALREALRQDPDVILVGEMRDLETIETVLTAAETGHLVLSTVHTFGSARTLDRIIDAFPAEHQNQIRTQLSLNLAAVLSQELIPRKDKEGRIAAFEIMVATPAVQNLIRKGQTYNIQNEIQTGAGFGMVSLQNHLIDLMKKGIISKEDTLFYSIDQDDTARRLKL
ncbi:MAG: type IV pilus twitching motility protein PilT [Candidatus Omnitrophota bacterium]